MKFKRWGAGLSAIIIGDSILFLVAVYMLYLKDINGFLYCFLMGLGWLGLIWICRKGLFYDTVYYDEKGIKIVTRKETEVCTWEEIRRFDRVLGGKGGTAGFDIVLNDGSTHYVSPMTGKFIKYVQNTHPEIEIR